MALNTNWLADHALARRIEAAWDRVSVENARSAALRRPECGAEVLAVGGGHAVYLGAESPLSQAQGIGLNGPVDSSELARMESFFRDRATPCRIEVASTADPSLLPMLSARGYTILEQSHMLALSLDDWRPPDRPEGRTEGEIVVERVGADAIEGWVDVILGSFFDGQEPPPALREGAVAMAMAAGATAWPTRPTATTAVWKRRRPIDSSG